MENQFLDPSVLDQAFSGDPKAVNQLFEAQIRNTKVEVGDDPKQNLIKPIFGQIVERQAPKPLVPGSPLPDTSLDTSNSRPSETNSEQEKEAHRQRAALLRYPEMRILMENIARRNPDIWAKIHAMVGRREDLLRDTALPGELHRVFAPLFAGLYADSRTGAYTDLVVSQAAQEVSNYLIEQIRNGFNYAPRVVIGAGLHGQILNAEYSHYHSNDMITFEATSDLGGTMLKGEWGLNSQTRPKNIDYEPIPGTRGALNDTGRGVLQQSDIEKDSYGSSRNWARVIRLNQLFAGHTALDSALKGPIKYIKDDPSQKGDYLLAFQRPDGSFTFGTDEPILATGVGKDSIKLEDTEDVVSQKIIQEELDKYLNGEIPQVMTYSQLQEILSDPSIDFPLKIFKDGYVVVGKGDGGTTAILQINGYYGEKRLSTVGVDYPENGVWLGQNAKTYEEFLKTSRVVYGKAGLTLPREDPGYYHRVDPAPGKAVRLRRDDGQIVIEYTETETGPIKEVRRPIVIFATGYENEIKKALEGLPIFDRQEIREFITALPRSPFRVFRPGTVIEYTEDEQQLSGNLRTIVSEVDRKGRPARARLVTYTTDGGKSETEIIINNNTMDSLRETFDFGTIIKSLSVPGIGPKLEPFKDPDDPNGPPIAAQVKGHNIKVIGPAAMLELTAQERARSSAFDKIPANTASNFRYEPKDARVAELLAQEPWDPEQAKPVLETNTALQAKPIELPRVQDASDQREKYSATAPLRRIKKGFDPAVASSDLVKLFFGGFLSRYHMPGDFPNDLTVGFSFREEGKLGQFNVTVSPRLPNNREYAIMMQKMISNENIQRVLFHIMRTQSSEVKAAEVHIPIENGGVNVNEIFAAIPYSNKGKMVRV